MSSTHRSRRSAILGALACALVLSATVGVAAARPIGESRSAAAVQQEKYYASFPELNQHPQGKYYASHGEPAPIAAPQAPAPADTTPWLTIALAVAAALATATVAATQRRRLRIRRPTRVTT